MQGILRKTLSRTAPHTAALNGPLIVGSGAGGGTIHCAAIPACLCTRARAARFPRLANGRGSQVAPAMPSPEHTRRLCEPLQTNPAMPQPGANRGPNYPHEGTPREGHAAFVVPADRWAWTMAR